MEYLEVLAGHQMNELWICDNNASLWPHEILVDWTIYFRQADKSMVAIQHVILHVFDSKYSASLSCGER